MLFIVFVKLYSILQITLVLKFIFDVQIIRTDFLHSNDFDYCALSKSSFDNLHKLLAKTTVFDGSLLNGTFSKPLTNQKTLSSDLVQHFLFALF